MFQEGHKLPCGCDGRGADSFAGAEQRTFIVGAQSVFYLRNTTGLVACKG